MNRPYSSAAPCFVLVALLAATLCSCKPNTQAPPNDGVAAGGSQTATATRVKRTGGMVSAEKNSFEAVTAKLDPGGSVYGYLSTEQLLTGLSARVSDWRQVLLSLPDVPDEAREGINKAFDIGARLIKNSGIEQVSGLGYSAIALEKGLYHSKFIVHHYPDQGSGCLWSVFGKKPHALKALDLLPATTALAAFGDLEVKEIWATFQQELRMSGFPEAEQFLAELPQQFEDATGVNLDKLIESLGGEVGVALVLDDGNKVTLPLPRSPVEIPAPGLMIVARVIDDTAFNLVEALLKKNPDIGQQLISTDEADLRMRTLPLPVPLPIQLRPTLARSGDYLILATTDALVRQALEAKAGKVPGLKTTAEFKRLAQGIPREGNHFSFLSKRLGTTLNDILRAAMQQETGQAPASVQALGKFLTLDLPQAFSVSAITPEGIQSLGNTDQDPAAGMLVRCSFGPVATVGLLSAIAIPNFVRARETAQRNACINNLRQLDGAKEQWALENRKTAEATPTMEDLVGQDKYIRVMPTCPANGQYTLGNMSTKPVCSVHGELPP